MYKKIWFKIHLILGLAAGIILLLVGVTGAVLSFEKEILKMINKDSYIVSIPKENHKKLETEILLTKFQEKIPDRKINRITFSSNANESVVINVEGKGKTARRGMNYFVNPYTAEILPNIKGKEFFFFNLRLHRWLTLTGDNREIGKQVVAISTVALIILSISGVIVYWVRIKKGFFKSLLINTQSSGRPFLANLHSTIGMWVLPFYLLASLTGLYWSYEWYRNALYTITDVEKPQRNKGKKTKVDVKNILTFNSHQKAIELFDDSIQKKYSSATLRLPKNGSSYTFSYLDINPDHYRARNNLTLDINTGEILNHEKYEDKRLGEKIMQSMLPLHSGEYFGRFGQVGMFIASALMALFTITGFMLYFKRNKKKAK